jgi:hypothetical protein
MKEIPVRVARLIGFAGDHARNDEGTRQFQTMYPHETGPASEFMTSSPALDSESAKKFTRRAAFVLATLPLVAFVVLTMKVML